MPPIPRLHPSGELLDQTPVHSLIRAEAPTPIGQRIEDLRLERIVIPPHHRKEGRLEPRSRLGERELQCELSLGVVRSTPAATGRGDQDIGQQPRLEGPGARPPLEIVEEGAPSGCEPKSAPVSECPTAVAEGGAEQGQPPELGVMGQGSLSHVEALQPVGETTDEPLARSGPSPAEVSPLEDLLEERPNDALGEGLLGTGRSASGASQPDKENAEPTCAPNPARPQAVAQGGEHHRRSFLEARYFMTPCAPIGATRNLSSPSFRA